MEKGQRFGKLVLIEKVGKNKWRDSLWKCRCDCGKEVIKAKQYFFRKKNPVKNCGCEIDYKRGVRKDLVGRKFNKLIVLKLDHTNLNNRHFWLCRCDCGNEVVVAGGHLYTGHNKSCGCYNDILRCQGRLPGEAGYNKIKRGYIKGAQYRNFKFELSEEDFKKLITDNCFYCGIKPSTVRNTGSARSTFVYNGIDRVDNLKGYEKNNVVTCCEKCNRMKGILGKEEFIRQCTSIYIHLSKNYK